MTTRRLRIVIPGGSGQVGTVLARAFHAEGHEVAVLSRPHGLRPGGPSPGMAARSRAGSANSTAPMSSSTSPAAA
jgi:nucleoside-diphosphate-sugar epimerase